MMDCWSRLGITSTASASDIKQAYASLIRVYRPDTHPEEFSAIREAYEAALQTVRAMEQWKIWEEKNVDDASFLPVQFEGVVDSSSCPADAPPENALDLKILPDLPAKPATKQGPNPGDLARLAAQAVGDAAIAMFREHIPWLDTQSIDARMDYEAVLLNELLTHEAPNLLLVAEASRLFRWDGREEELGEIWGGNATRKVGALLELSQLFVHHRFFSSNGLLRRAMGAAPQKSALIVPGLYLPLARNAAERWIQHCQSALLPGLEKTLQLPLLDQAQVHAIRSTDLFTALVATWLIHGMMDDARNFTHWMIVLIEVAALMLLTVLPKLGRLADSIFPINRFLIQRCRISSGLWGVAALTAMVGMGVGLAVRDQSSLWSRIGWMVVTGAPRFGFFYTAMWKIVQLVEIFLGMPILKIQQASDRVMFDLACKNGNLCWDDATPTLKQRTHHMPETLAFAWNNSRARFTNWLKRPRVQKQKSGGWNRNISPYWLWLALPLLSALAKLWRM